MLLETTARNAAVDGVTALLNSGDIRFESAAHAEVATCGLDASAFGAAASGTATAATITDDTSAAGGTVDHAHLRNGAAAAQAQCTCGTSATDFILTSLTIGVGDKVSVTSLTLTQPAGSA